MSDCFFCGDFVGEVNGDGGVKGRTIGNKDICEQCLGELKHWLNGALPRSPGMRERPLKVDDDTYNENEEEVVLDAESSDDANEDHANEDPLSSGAKI